MENRENFYDGISYAVGPFTLKLAANRAPREVLEAATRLIEAAGNAASSHDGKDLVLARNVRAAAIDVQNALTRHNLEPSDMINAVEKRLTEIISTLEIAEQANASQKAFKPPFRGPSFNTMPYLCLPLTLLF